jgi:hypothetical protein
MDVAFTIFRVREGRNILDWANQGDDQNDGKLIHPVRD